MDGRRRRRRRADSLVGSNRLVYDCNNNVDHDDKVRIAPWMFWRILDLAQSHRPWDVKDALPLDPAGSTSNPVTTELVECEREPETILDN